MLPSIKTQMADILAKGRKKGVLSFGDLDPLLDRAEFFRSGYVRFIKELNEKRIDLVPGGEGIASSKWRERNRPVSHDPEAPSKDPTAIYFTDLSSYRLLTKDEEVLIARRIEFTRRRFFETLKRYKIPRAALRNELNLDIFDESLGDSAARRRRKAKVPQVKVPPQVMRVVKRRYNEYLMAREELVERNLALVVYVAKDYMNKGISLQDLIQEGNTGLMRAVEKFDWRKGYRFKTYANFWIQQAMLRAIHNHSRTVRIPIYLRRKIKKIRDLEASSEGGEASLEKIGKQLGESAESVRKAMEAGKYILSLDEPINGDNTASSMDLIEDSKAPAVAEHMDLESLRQDLTRVLSSLDKREEQILRMRFGLDRGSPKTLEEVSKVFNLSKERIRQIQEEALRKLQLPEKSRPLVAYL